MALLWFYIIVTCLCQEVQKFGIYYFYMNLTETVNVLTLSYMNRWCPLAYINEVCSKLCTVGIGIILFVYFAKVNRSFQMLTKWIQLLCLINDSNNLRTWLDSDLSKLHFNMNFDSHVQQYSSRNHYIFAVNLVMYHLWHLCCNFIVAVQLILFIKYIIMGMKIFEWAYGSWFTHPSP